MIPPGKLDRWAGWMEFLCSQYILRQMTLDWYNPINIFCPVPADFRFIHDLNGLIERDQPLSLWWNSVV